MTATSTAVGPTKWEGFRGEPVLTDCRSDLRPLDCRREEGWMLASRWGKGSTPLPPESPRQTKTSPEFREGP